MITKPRSPEGPMIPTTADNTTHDRYVANILATWQRATAGQMADGRSWYRHANDLADIMSDGNVRAGAGVIAALSANKAWEINIRIAGEAFATGTLRGHVRDALAKAERIMMGQNPLVVLPIDSKTHNFYRCIVDPDDPDPVVIDRHAHDVAVGRRYGNEDRGLSNKRRYATLAHAYREAARRLGELPSTVQAVTWVAWREGAK
jgi:hypothetical protein